jgi:pimeloyl-ACP methyl ester carboxylesterase
MNLAYSADGTAISYRSTGTGPAIVLVPGAMGMASDYDNIARELSHQFTVHVVDRRGRGGSGPQGDDYNVEKECEDLRAVCAATNAAFLFGHSYGGFVVLEAAQRDPNIQKIAVYEPGLSIDGSINMDWAEPCHDHGKSTDAFITFIYSVNPAVAGIPRWIFRIILRFIMKRDELELKCNLLPTTVAEHAELVRLDNSYPRYSKISAKVLLLVGKNVQQGSPGWASTQLFPVLTNASLLSFPKLDHLGPEKDPQKIAAALTKFFSEGSSSSTV